MTTQISVNPDPSYSRVGPGLWIMSQQNLDPTQGGTPPRLVLKFPPAPISRRTNVGPAITIVDPSITGDVQIAARAFSVHGMIQVSFLQNLPPFQVTNPVLEWAGPPHNRGVVPLLYSVQNPGAAGPWCPPWDGDYRVYADDQCLALLATRLSGEIYQVALGATVFIYQQARL